MNNSTRKISKRDTLFASMMQFIDGIIPLRYHRSMFHLHKARVFLVINFTIAMLFANLFVYHLIFKVESQVELLRLLYNALLFAAILLHFIRFRKMRLSLQVLFFFYSLSIIAGVFIAHNTELKLLLSIMIYPLFPVLFGNRRQFVFWTGIMLGLIALLILQRELYNVWDTHHWAVFILFILFQFVFTLSFIYQTRAQGSRVKKMMTASRHAHEAIREKDRMLSTAIHDLKSPLNRIEGFVEIMKLTSGESEEIKGYLSRIREIIHEGRDILGDLLYSYHDVHNLEYTILNPDQIISEVLPMYAAQAANKNIVIQKNPTHITANIRVSRVHFIRIIENLLSNAIKFSQPDSQVTLDLEQGRHDIKISITDQGPGFTEEDKRKMFRMFQTLSAKPTNGESSTGMGLYIVKKFSDLLDIEIGLSSQKGKGSTFSLTIPISNW